MIRSIGDVADESAVVPVLGARHRGHDSRQRPRRAEFVELERDGVATAFDLEGTWNPDGFAGTLAELARAIAEDREPFNSARHNLLSLAITLAACRSAEEGSRLVAVDE